jgi:hypothetical protein
MLRTLVVTVVLAGSTAFAAEPVMKPYVLASRGPGEPGAVAADLKARLAAAGFEVAGSYQPYPGAVVLAVTSAALKEAAARTEFGGYAAAQRVTVTQVGDEVQVAYTSPAYMAAAYRLESDLAGVSSALAAALGRLEEYGPDEGKTAKELRSYHYMMGMPRFDEPLRFGKYASHAAAVAAVEAGLKAHRGGTSKVYRIDLPGGKQTVFGVALTRGCSGDELIMKEIDFKPLRSTGHLPYELLVVGDEVVALHAKFRIAMNFTDLEMMGSHSFMNIRCAPGAIGDALDTLLGP